MVRERGKQLNGVLVGVLWLETQKCGEGMLDRQILGAA
jgi:hypothetical protein